MNCFYMYTSYHPGLQTSSVGLALPLLRQIHPLLPLSWHQHDKTPSPCREVQSTWEVKAEHVTLRPLPCPIPGCLLFGLHSEERMLLTVSPQQVAGVAQMVPVAVGTLPVYPSHTVHVATRADDTGKLQP